MWKIVEIYWSPLYLTFVNTNAFYFINLIDFLTDRYRKVSNSGRGYYSFLDLKAASSIWGRLLFKGAHYKSILLFPKKIAILKHF